MVGLRSSWEIHSKSARLGLMCEDKDANDGEQGIDFSVLPYEDWIEVVFNRPVSKHPWAGIEFAFEPRVPAVLIEHLTRMCLEFASLRPRFSWEEIDQGVWSALTYPVESVMLLFRESIPLDVRLSCIKAMYKVFSGTVCKIKEDISNVTCFFMWWDLIAFEFCGQRNRGTKEAFLPKNKGDQELQDTIFETLVRILKLDDTKCRKSALHGLSHLHHPKGADVVQSFIDSHGGEYTEEEIKWMQGCRDGMVL